MLLASAFARLSLLKTNIYYPFQVTTVGEELLYNPRLAKDKVNYNKVLSSPLLFMVA